MAFKVNDKVITTYRYKRNQVGTIVAIYRSSAVVKTLYEEASHKMDKLKHFEE